VFSKNSERILATLFLIICAAIPAIGQVSSAKTSGGMVERIVLDGIASIKGIPYTAPPVAICAGMRRNR
jgi:hypothetical protein